MNSEQYTFDELKYNVIIDEYGSKIYRNQKGELHRDEGPAVIWRNGQQAWYRNGKYHREDGPAIIWADGTQFWFLNDIEYTKEEWEDAIRTRRF